MMADRIPSYRLHRPTGQAVVTLDGKDRYLGKHGTEASREAYDALIGRWIAFGRKLPVVEESPTVAEVLGAYLDHASRYYRKGGKPTSEVRNIRFVIESTLNISGGTPAREFTPSRFVRVRQSWIDSGACRRTANAYANILRRAFAWAAEQEMVPGPVAITLRTIPGLRKGRSGATERPPVGPAPLADVEAALAELQPGRRAMARLQLATGMRPGEVCRIRPGDIDRSGPVWYYTPGSHKTEHHEKARVIALGPKAQATLRPWLDGVRPDRYVFCRNGRTPVHTNSYRDSIAAACVRAGVPHWHPNQLRKNFATFIRSVSTLDTVQVLLGHSKADTSEIYAEADKKKADEAIEKWG